MAGPRGEERPAVLLEPRLQGDVQRHAGIGYELAQNLDVLVLQMGEQLPDVLQLFASFLPVVAEQVIEVPKIFLDTTPERLGDHMRQPQRVEQLVHVPTVVSSSSLQQHHCRADRRHSSSGWRRRRGAWRSSEFSPKTEFSSCACRADR